MHLLYAAFITDTFTWGLAFTVSNGALYTGVPRICSKGGAGVVPHTLALSVSDDKWGRSIHLCCHIHKRNLAFVKGIKHRAVISATRIHQV